MVYIFVFYGASMKRISLLQTIKISSASLCCAMLLSACSGGGSGNSNPDSNEITAIFSQLPADIPANSQFTVSVELKALDNHLRVSALSQQYKLSLEDTGSKTPRIECPGTALAEVGGPAAKFTCTAPVATPSDIGEHQLTIIGPSNIKVNNNSVDVNIVNGGDVIASVSPSSVNAGNDVTVSFTGQQGAAGTYTLSNIPKNWFQGANTCTISSKAPGCQLRFKVPSSQPSGPLQIAATASKFGSSTLNNGKT